MPHPMHLAFRILLPPAFLATTACAAVDFAHQIVPILKEHCAECHAGDKKKGGLSINDRASLITGGENGAVLVVGQSSKSKLLEAILSKDPDEQMPPKGARLSAEKVALLKAWIDEGLAWEDGFAFKKPSYEPPLKPRRPELPPALDGRTNEVDRILDAYLAQKKVPHPPALDDAAFMRRVSMDIIGLLPQPEALKKFLDDKSANKRTQLVQTLLKDDAAYAEHWLTFWNDLLRNDYGGTGFITGGRKQISKWLYEALVTNKPFDAFVRELIAPTPESDGYISGIKWRGEVSAGQTVEIQFAQSISQSFLGINMKCASCHDSFIDRWKLDEAYGLAAIYSTRVLDIARCDKATGKKAEAAWLFPELGQVDAKAAQPARLKQLAELMTHKDNGRVTRTMVNRLWQRLMGRGIVHPVDAMQTEPWSSDLLDYLAVHFSDNGYDLKKTLALIASSQAYQSKASVLAKDTDDHGYTYAGPRAKRMSAEQFMDAVWQLTGTAPTKMDAALTRGKADTAGAQKIKLQAQWLWGDSAKDGTPPSDEVIAMRKTFTVRAGILRAGAAITCDNEFTLYVNDKEITKSTAWETFKAVSLEAALKTGESTITVIAKNGGKGPNAAGLFFEGRIRYADGKEDVVVSDATWEWNKTLPKTQKNQITAVKTGWEPATVLPALPAWTAAADAQAAPLLAQTVLGEQLMVRASLMKSDFLMRVLGRPNREQIVSMRPNDLTTLEAIDLSNGPVLASTLERGAKNLLGKNWVSSQDFITWLYHHALSREPSANELTAAKEACGETLNAQGVQDLLWAVVMLPEFQLVR
jgi:hypothetical protein